MQSILEINEEFASLDKIVNYINTNTSFGASIVYDHWEVRTDTNGQMEQCVLIKKSGMHGAKAYFIYKNTLNIGYIIPNKVMDAYFGKSQKAYKNILDIVAGSIKNVLLANSQKNAFNEIVQTFDKIKNK